MNLGLCARLEWNAPLALNSAGEQICCVSFFGVGGGERLRRAVGFYDEHLVAELILVGEHQGECEHILRRYCPECDLTDRRATIYPKVIWNSGCELRK